MCKTLAPMFLLFSFCAFCQALEVKIPYALVQKEVERQVFTDGRSYLSGDRSSTCEYAYLDNPSVFPQEGRLALQATFRGKTGREVLGKCVGVGKSFDIVVTGSPAYREGMLRFDDAELQFKNPVADAVFGRLLNQFAEDLERDLTFPLQADVRQLSQTLSQGTAAVQLRVEKLSVSSIEVLSEAIRLQIDTTIVVEEKPAPSH